VEIQINEALAIKRRRMARRLVLFGFIVLVGSLFIGARDARTVTLSYAALIVGTLASWGGVMMMHRWTLPPKPEVALGEAMAGSNAGWKLYHWLLPADHVVQAPWGLAVLDPFNFDGRLRVDGARWRDGRSALRRIFAIGQRPVRNPERVLDQQVEALRAALVERDARWAEVPIERALVLTHPRAALEAEMPNVPVHLAADLKRALAKGQPHRALKPVDQRALRDELDALAEQRLAQAGDGKDADAESDAESDEQTEG
jgi:hypothetical protein